MDTTIQLPTSLHALLNQRAHREGVSLDRYLIYALTEHLASTKGRDVVSRHEIEEQEMRFESLLTAYPKPSQAEVEAAYAAWEDAPPGDTADVSIEAALRAKIDQAQQSKQAN